MVTSTTRRRRAAAILAFAASLALAAPIAEARPGAGGGMGSRGSKTFSPPSATATAPGAAPIQRSQTQAGPAMGNPGMNPAPAARPRFGGGFMAGLLGAGLLGALLGGGFFGGLGGIASMIGLLLQVGLLVLVVSFVVRWFRRRQDAPAAAGFARNDLGGTGQGNLAQGNLAQGNMAPGGIGQGGYGGGPAAAAAPLGKVAIGPGDFESFEHALKDVQDAYGREDLAALRNLATPEMAGYFAEELRGNAERGVVNRISDVKLLQGDLSGSWSEGATEFATVAMRYGLTDVTLDRRSNTVVETGEPVATELWTFVRQRGGRWILSAIQQGR